MCLVLLFASCEDSINISHEDAIIKVTVLDNNGNPVSHKTVYMFTEEFPITYTNVYFRGQDKTSETNFTKKNASASEVTGTDGVATFIIDGGDLVGSCIFSILDLDKTTINVFPKYGGTTAAILKPSNNFAENLELSRVVITPNADGTINIEFDINNVNIKTLCIYDADGAVAEDLLMHNTLDGIFYNHVVSQPLPVDEYYIIAKTQDDQTANIALGEKIEYRIGSLKSVNGSYLSIIDNRQMTMETATTYPAEVIAESSYDGYVAGLRAAIHATNAAVAAKAGKVAFFQDGNRVDNSVGVGATIITESGCICKVNSIQLDASSADAQITMYTIKSNDQITVNCSVLTFSK